MRDPGGKPMSREWEYRQVIFNISHSIYASSTSRHACTQFRSCKAHLQTWVVKWQTDPFCDATRSLCEQEEKCIGDTFNALAKITFNMLFKFSSRFKMVVSFRYLFD